MSQSRDGTDANIVIAQDVVTVPPVVNVGAAGSSYNPFSESRPPFIHDAASRDESSSSEDEGEDSEEGEKVDEPKNQEREGEAPLLQDASSASQL